MDCEHNQRCTGHCCRHFYLPFKPDELKDEATREDRYEKTRFNPKEVEQIYALAVPLQPACEADFANNGFSKPPDIGWYYTCRYLNVISGDCTNYDNRPNMCRDYPFYGGVNNRCKIPDCTWEAARNPPVMVNSRSLTRKLQRDLISNDQTIK